MSVAGHELWSELEEYFKTDFYPHERRAIIGLIQGALQHAPDLDLDELTFQAASMILKKRLQKIAC